MGVLLQPADQLSVLVITRFSVSMLLFPAFPLRFLCLCQTALVVNMLFQFADQLSVFIKAVFIMAVCFFSADIRGFLFSAVIADQFSLFVVAFQTVDMGHIVAADHISFLVVAFFTVDMERCACIDGRDLIRSQLHHFEALSPMDVFQKLRLPAGRPGTFQEFSVLVEAVFAVAAIVMDMRLRFPAGQYGLRLVALRSMRMTFFAFLFVLCTGQHFVPFIARICVLMGFALRLLTVQLCLITVFSMGMFLSVADEGLCIAVLSMLMIFFLAAAGQFLIVTAIVMSMLFQCTDHFLCIAFFSVGMGSASVLCTHQLALLQGIAFLCVLMTGRSLCLGFLTDKDLFFFITSVVMLMGCKLRKRTDQLSIPVTVVIVDMNHLIRLHAYQTALFVIAAFCMLMHGILAVQYLYLMRHCLTIQLQRRDRPKGNGGRKAQEHCQPAFIIFTILQKFCSL